MERVYFISYEVKTKLGQKKDMFEVTLPRKIRNFFDVKNVAHLIENNLTPVLGECEVVILGWQELEESMEHIRAEKERLQQEISATEEQVQDIEADIPVAVPVEQQ